MDENSLYAKNEMNLVIQEVKAVLDNARNNVAHQVNSELLNTYWNIGAVKSYAQIRLQALAE